MKIRCTAYIIIAALCSLASTGHAYTREKRYKEPKLPGITRSASCKQLAPGVYDCGNHQMRKSRTQNKKSGRWKITYRPTDDITITAKSKAERDANKRNR